MASSRTGFLLIGHGTRSEAGRGQCVALADLVQQRLREEGEVGPLELAFLELAEPSIRQAVGRLVAEGVERLVVFPMLLFAAGHARDDIPRAVRQALAANGATALPTVQTQPLGCHPAIVALSARQYQDALGGDVGRPGDCLLMVGRGTSDPAAQADFMDFVAQRRTALGATPVAAAYLAQARPTFDEQLERLVSERFTRIVVQPHLLFSGELTESIRQRVAAVAERSCERRWLVMPPLAEGVLRCQAQQRLWMEAVLARMQEVGIRVVGHDGQR